MTLRSQPVRVLTTAVVCVSLAAYGAVADWVAPVSARLNYDPSLQYLLSSLSWFHGGTYDYIDHPGTPVEVLGSVLLGLMYPFTASGPDGFVHFQLAHPQVFLSIAQTVVLACSLAVCVLLAWRSIAVAHWAQALVAAAIAGLFFIVLPDAFQSLAIWSHESFCFPAGTLLSLLLLLAVRRAGPLSWRVVLGLGFGAGVLTSVQLYFAAWVVGIPLALSIATRLKGSSWRSAGLRGAAAIGMAAVGFVVATLPIHERYRQFAGWIRLLVSHQGIYGSGPAGFSSPDLMAFNLGAMVVAAPLVFVASGAALLALCWRLWRSRRRPGSEVTTWSVGLGLVAQLLVLLVMVTKHPGVRYLLPVAATVPILAATAVDGLDPRNIWTRALLAGLGLGLLGAFVAAFASALVAHLSAVDGLRRDDTATEVMLARLAQQRLVDREALRVLWTYGTTSPCYALWFGDDSADNLFRDDIARLCPRDANLNVWNADVTSSSGKTTVASAPDWDVAVVGEDMTRLNPQSRPVGMVLRSSIPSLGYGALLFIVSDTIRRP